MRHGRCWMVQWCWDGWLSFGVHVDWTTRVRSSDGMRYGPYVDVHLGCVIVSVGRNPVYSGEIESRVSVGRGGLKVD